MRDIIDSFKMGDKGFSSRKLTAFIIVACIVAAHIKWITLGDFSQLETVFLIDYGFIAALFGMTTYSSLSNNKGSSNNSQS
jgi:hypothetical protein